MIELSVTPPTFRDVLENLKYKYQIDFIISDETYEGIEWYCDESKILDKKSLEKQLFSLHENRRLDAINAKRRSEYPSSDEWMMAFIQKELDNQPNEWNALVQKRIDIKNKYPK